MLWASVFLHFFLTSLFLTFSTVSFSTYQSLFLPPCTPLSLLPHVSFAFLCIPFSLFSISISLCLSVFFFLSFSGGRERRRRTSLSTNVSCFGRAPSIFHFFLSFCHFLCASASLFISLLLYSWNFYSFMLLPSASLFVSALIDLFFFSSIFTSILFLLSLFLSHSLLYIGSPSPKHILKEVYEDEVGCIAICAYMSVLGIQSFSNKYTQILVEFDLSGMQSSFSGR